MPNYTRLMYACTSNALPCTIKTHIVGLLSQVSYNTDKLDMAGILVCGNGYIFHCIEIPTELIEPIQQAVANNSYSQAFKLLHCEPISQRYFQSWDVKFFMQDNAIEQFFKKHDWEKFNPYILHDELLQQFMPVLMNKMEKITEPNWASTRLSVANTGQVIHYHYMVVIVLAMLLILMFYVMMQYFGFTPKSGSITNNAFF